MIIFVPNLVQHPFCWVWRRWKRRLSWQRLCQKVQNEISQPRSAIVEEIAMLVWSNCWSQLLIAGFHAKGKHLWYDSECTYNHTYRQAMFEACFCCARLEMRAASQLLVPMMDSNADSFGPCILWGCRHHMPVPVIKVQAVCRWLAPPSQTHTSTRSQTQLYRTYLLGLWLADPALTVELLVLFDEREAPQPFLHSQCCSRPFRISPSRKWSIGKIVTHRRCACLVGLWLPSALSAVWVEMAPYNNPDSLQCSFVTFKLVSGWVI